MLKNYAAILDAGVGGGTPCYFDSFTNVSSGAGFYQEDATIKGAAGASVQLQITTSFTDNSVGALIVDAQVCVLNRIVFVTLDGTGSVTYTQKVEGNPAETGTQINAIITIVGVSIGSIGTPNSRPISKIF